MLESPHILLGSILMCFALKIYLLLFASNYHTMNTLIQRIWWLSKYWHCRKGIFSMGRGVQYQAKDNCANYWLKWLLLFANNHYKYREDNDKLIIFFPFFQYFSALKICKISDFRLLKRYENQAMHAYTLAHHLCAHRPGCGSGLLPVCTQPYWLVNSKQDLWLQKQARKPRSYASSKLRLNYSLTGVKCRATSVAKKFWFRKDKCHCRLQGDS